ncbi:MAG: gliding motility-associated C-terminal domain-containing protein, partial [Cyclobacteriaceae bacterium]
FRPSYQATIAEQTCDEDFFIHVGNTLFDIDNPSGSTNLQTSYGCDSIVNVDIDYHILPTLALDQSEDKILVLGDLTSVSNLSWTPSLGLSCDDCERPLASPGVNTLYVLSYANDLGCLDTTSILFLVQEKKGDIILPNVIDPSSTSNQYFYVPREGITILSMKIYDRWGSAVFSNQNFASGVPELGWNGQFNNREVRPGVYVYYIQVMVDGVVKEFVGDVTVVR